MKSAYADLQAYHGDIHNHCGISYGHGSIEEAFANARLQLDFVSVTGHAYWPDMPPKQGRLVPVVEYHERGFARLATVWDDVVSMTNDLNIDGRFVTFPSFEWHCMKHGDHCVYFNGPETPIIRARDLNGLRTSLRELAERGTKSFMIPHHIAYATGWRGANWDDFTSEFTPVVEMMSSHGCGEFDDGPRPYLNIMGPRDGRSSLHEALRRGLRFGFIGSTDHHAGHPGSYGQGRIAVWARDLSRRSIWEAIEARRTYALTGDRIALAVTLNGVLMGQTADADEVREIDIDVIGGGPVDYVEVVRNGRPVFRRSAHEETLVAGVGFHGLVAIAVGWGTRGEEIHWNVDLRVERGRLLRVEPRFRGDYVIEPQAEDDAYHYSSWERCGSSGVRFRTRTRGNPNTVTDATQSVALEIEGDDTTRIIANINGRTVEHTVEELRTGSRSDYLDGFLSAAYRFDRAVPWSELAWRARFEDRRPAQAKDYYYVRVRQLNDQWAWSSPLWMGSEERRSHRADQ